MFCNDIPNPLYIIFSESTPSLLYYSHIPTAIVALALAFFIFIKNRKDPSSILLLIVSMLFSLWSFLDLVLWTNNKSSVIAFSWLLIRITEVLIPVSVFYFSYWVVKKNDPPFFLKLFFLFLIFPVLIFIPTKLHFRIFDLSVCEPIEGATLNYFYFLEPLVFVLLVFFLIKEIFREKKENRKKIILFSIGSSLFLLSFLGTNLLGNFTLNWEILQYGLFGMPVFIGFLSYLILKYQAFNVKVIATQYFIVVIWVLVSSQFFISQERSAYIPITLSWLIITLAGFWLFRIMGKEEETAKKLTAASARLSRINEKLKEISRAKSEFISIASHQLRTPLTSIKGYTSLILEKTFGTVPRRQEEAIEKVLINNEKLVLLVEDMLNVSRLEAGRLEYDFEKQPILPIVEDAISNLKLYAKNKGLSVKLLRCRDAKNFNVIADSRKVFEILSNLIDNAIKYTDKGGLTVKVEKTKHYQKIGRSDEAVTKVADWVKISVTDSGIGIEKKNLESIFEKYRQGGSLTGENTPASTGLGIYIGRQMAKAHGGKLYATSEGRGKGSTFILCLPLAQENGEK